MRHLSLLFALLICGPLCQLTSAAPPASSSSSSGVAPEPPLGASPTLPAVKDLRTRLETLEKRVLARQAPADAQNLPLMLFKLEQARLWLGLLERDEAFSPLTAQRELVATLDRASVISRALGDAVLPSASQMHERAYFAADGSVQPYWVFVPKNYSARQKYPMIVFLHGYDPNISKIEPWIPSEQTWSLATNRGFIFAIPYGRRNSDFVNIGEDDTVAVTNAVKTRYSIDNTRVHLMGASMGGYGAYTVGLHRPDMWSTLSIMSGRTDFYLWFKLDRNQVPSWKRLLYDADDPRHLKTNALHLPIFIQHGELDSIVDPEHSRRFTKDLTALRYAVRYREIAGADHYIYWQDNPYEAGFDWLAKLRRVQAPRRVRYTTGTLRDHRAYWADIQSFKDYGRLASIDAEIKSGNLLEVKTDNIGQFILTPPTAYVDPKKPITLKVNGELDTRKFNAGQPIAWPASASAGADVTIARVQDTATAVGTATNNPTPSTPPTQLPAVIKTPQRSGPIKNCYRDPFLLVYGTLQASAVNTPVAGQGIGVKGGEATAQKTVTNGSTQDSSIPNGSTQNGTGNNGGEQNVQPLNPLDELARRNPDEANARRFQVEWYRFADGILPAKADKQVTEADRKRYNLILFGTRQSNSILAEIADTLPVELTPTGYRIGKEQFTGTDLGVQLCYPSPFDARRMIIVQSGIFWGEGLPINHKYDLLPDYIVYNKTLDPVDSTNQALAAGYFDGNWQLTKTENTAAPTSNPAATNAATGNSTASNGG